MPVSESMKIFTEVCDRLGMLLEKEGFKYLKSRRTATRKGSIFDQLITFSTSRSINSLEGHIHLEVNAMACREEFGDFRRESGINIPINESFLFSSTIENLFVRPPPYIRYNVGNPQNREQVVKSIERVLLEDVMKAFFLIEEPEELKLFLEENEFPAMEPFNSINDYFAYIKKMVHNCRGPDT